MRRRYINQGLAGPDHGSASFGEGRTSTNGQGVAILLSGPGYDGHYSIILDAEQVADLRDYLLKICPCAGTEKARKIVDES